MAIKTIRDLARVQLREPNYWYFQFDDFPDVHLYVQSISLPFEQLETSTRNTGEKFYTGVTPIEDITISFLETTDFQIYAYLKGWFESVYDSRKRVFRRGNNTKTGSLTYTSPRFVILPVQQKVFQFINMRIKGVQQFESSYGDDGPVLTTAIFSANVTRDEDRNVFEAPGPGEINLEQFGIT